LPTHLKKIILAGSNNEIYNPSTFPTFLVQYNVSNTDAMAR
jgi:hypothetical protein